MKIRLLPLFALLFPFICLSQTPSEKASVEVIAEATETPFPQIKLSWKDDLSATLWSIYKKNDTGAYELLKTVQSPATSYTDDRVKVGRSYTYLIHKEDVNSVLGFSQITAGIKTTASSFSGTCLLMVEDSVQQLLPKEVERLKQDMEKEGWVVHLKGISSAFDHFEVKDSILNCYRTYKGINTLLLLGNIAVPYSGYMAPDGHNPSTTPSADHLGAWSCDLYYADLDGVWTDVTVSATNNPERNINKNLPGDGKFDQNTLPSDADLQVGRIYLEKLGNFESDRMVLYKRHLDRNHAFRSSQIKYRNRSLINDYFVGLQEGFASFGFRSFPSIAGPDSVQTGALLDYARDSSFLISYGCGAGYYNKVGVKLRNSQGQRIDSFSVTQTSDYFDYEINSAFNILFGSYFGDWDSKDNVMRATLAGKSPALASFWAGRPTWHINEFLHGAPLGTSTRNSQNSDIDMFAYIELNGWTYERMTHPALMGDPTVCIRYSQPMTSLNAKLSKDSSSVRLQWDDSQYNSFYVYRWIPDSHKYRLITPSPIAADTLWDSLPNIGTNKYMVRGFSVHNGYTGSYEMLSPGIETTITGVKRVFTSLTLPKQGANVSIYPNPATDRVHISTDLSSKGNYRVLTPEGKEVFSGALKSGDRTTSFDISLYPKGIYLLEIQSKTRTSTHQLIVF